MSQKTLLPYVLPAIILSTLLVTAIIWAWNEPTAVPPGGNVPAPLNVSINDQAKLGRLAIGTSTLPTFTLDVYNGAAWIRGGFRTDQATYLAVDAAHNVGIGKTDPQTKLDVAGTVRMTGFQLGTSATAGYVLTANASGVGTWQAPSGGITWPLRSPIDGTIAEPAYSWSADTNMGIRRGGTDDLRFVTNGADRLTINSVGNVGIGTTIIDSNAKLEVAGQIKITGGSPGAGKVLTSDANGLATWQTVSGGGGGLKTFIGCTAASYSGRDVGGPPYSGSTFGYSTANEKCNTAFPGSRMCMAADFVNGFPTCAGWYNTFIAYYINVSGVPHFANDCLGWKTNDGTGVGNFFPGTGLWLGAVWNPSNNYPYFQNCQNPAPITCCR